jgi:pyruvate/2-oxoglutarate/acetoin dehydrogenase E1 component
MHPLIDISSSAASRRKLPGSSFSMFLQGLSGNKTNKKIQHSIYTEKVFSNIHGVKVKIDMKRI